LLSTTNDIIFDVVHKSAALIVCISSCILLLMSGNGIIIHFPKLTSGKNGCGVSSKLSFTLYSHAQASRSFSTLLF